MLGGFGQSQVFGMGIMLGFQNKAKAGMRDAAGDFDRMKMSASAADKQMASSLTHMQTSMKQARNSMFIGAVGLTALGALSISNRDTEQYTADLRSLGTKAADAHVRAVRDIVAHQNLPIDYARGLSELYSQYSGGIAESDLVPVLKNAGVTALATMGDISEAIGAFVTDYNLGIKEMSGTIEERSTRWADVVSATVQQYRTKLPELAEQHQKIASDAAFMGYKMEETYTAIGALLSGGLGQEAGTSLRRALQKLGNAGEVTGLQFTDAAGRAKPLLEIIDLLREQYGSDLTVAQMAEIEKAFDTYGKKAIMTLMKMRDSYAEGIEKAKQMGFAQDMMGKRTDTLNYDIKNLSNTMKNFGDTVAENGLNVRDWVQSLDTGIDKLSQTIERNPILAEVGFEGGALLSTFLLGGGAIWAIRLAAGQWGTMAAGVFGKSFVATLGPYLSSALPFILAGYLAYKGGKHYSTKNPMGAAADAETEFEVEGPFGSKRKYRTKGMNLEYVEREPVDVKDYKGPVFEMRGPVDKTAIIAAGGSVMETKGKAASAPQEISNSFNTTIHVKSTDPVEARKEIEKFLRQRNEDIKRWMNLRRGEAPGEYEN